MEDTARRAALVREQLRGRDIDDERLLAAMSDVPRELFVPAEHSELAYADTALPIGGGQTISQPYMVALICQALTLRGTERVLEIGTGSGYSAAILARLAAEVVTVERDGQLAERARQTLAQLGTERVSVLHGDGIGGVPEQAPFDAIAVHATAAERPDTLLGQLAEGGRAVVPVQRAEHDVLMRYTRSGDRIEDEPLIPVRFVPLVAERT